MGDDMRPLRGKDGNPITPEEEARLQQVADEADAEDRKPTTKRRGAASSGAAADNKPKSRWRRGQN